MNKYELIFQDKLQELETLFEETETDKNKIGDYSYALTYLGIQYDTAWYEYTKLERDLNMVMDNYRSELTDQYYNVKVEKTNLKFQAEMSELGAQMSYLKMVGSILKRHEQRMTYLKTSIYRFSN